jgi:hypothetical protein
VHASTHTQASHHASTGHPSRAAVIPLPPPSQSLSQGAPFSLPCRCPRVPSRVPCHVLTKRCIISSPTTLFPATAPLGRFVEHLSFSPKNPLGFCCTRRPTRRLGHNRSPQISCGQPLTALAHAGPHRSVATADPAKILCAGHVDHSVGCHLCKRQLIAAYVTAASAPRAS